MKSSVLIVVLALSLSACDAQTSTEKSDVPAQPTPAQKTKSAKLNEGDLLFATHCMRCHMAPTTISQRTTGTIIMHMRARARLSTHDEQQLLKYLAP